MSPYETLMPKKTFQSAPIYSPPSALSENLSMLEVGAKGCLTNTLMTNPGGWQIGAAVGLRAGGPIGAVEGAFIGAGATCINGALQAQRACETDVQGTNHRCTRDENSRGGLREVFWPFSSRFWIYRWSIDFKFYPFWLTSFLKNVWVDRAGHTAHCNRKFTVAADLEWLAT